MRVCNELMEIGYVIHLYSKELGYRTYFVEKMNSKKKLKD